jgi:hypothetical protein
MLIDAIRITFVPGPARAMQVRISALITYKSGSVPIGFIKKQYVGPGDISPIFRANQFIPGEECLSMELSTESIRV